MSKFGKMGTLCLTVLLALAFSSVPGTAEARHHHAPHKKSHVVHKKARHPAKSGKTTKDAAVSVRAAQMQLADLGYYTGAVDGKMGPMTSRSIQNFQRDHGMALTGRLDSVTATALAQAAYDVRGRGVRRDGHPVAIRAVPMTMNVAPPVIQGPMAMTSRFGSFDVRDDQPAEGVRNYAVILNGQTVLTAVNQPGTLRVSPTYELGNEDAVLFTVYTGKTECLYDNHLLVIQSNGASTIKDIPVCAGENSGHVKDGSLFVEFPNGYDGSTTGVTWRYDRGTLNPLL